MVITYLLLIFIILSFLILFSLKPKKQPDKNIVFKTNSDLYDKDYATIYDMIHYDYYRLQKELSVIEPTTTTDSYVLDIGSGTGMHVNEFNKKNIPTIGIDNSSAMIQYSKKYKHNYIKGDALIMSSFHPESFSHITCFYYTFYYIENKEQLLYNIYQWLMPDGLFIVHLTDKCNFGKPNVISSTFKYKRTIKDNKVYETITYPTKSVRNEHTFYMESIPFIVDLAKKHGFVVESNHNYDVNNFIYVFKKAVY
jgi:ubiquinone/menaquinone biosynthesis C-methylase UbiE